MVTTVSSVKTYEESTSKVLSWLRGYVLGHGGALPSFTNARAAKIAGMKPGRAFGNIQSRIDFACYLAGLPPLGLAARVPFKQAWKRKDRLWVYPIADMRAAALTRRWKTIDFARILQEVKGQPGSAHLSWQNEDTAKIKKWAFGLNASNDFPQETAAKRNPAWSRDELVLALDLYLRFRKAPPEKDSREVGELSALLGKRGRLLGLTEAETYRNRNGVYMKMMNFRRFDTAYTGGGRVGLKRGNKLEQGVWDEFSTRLTQLQAAVQAIRSSFKAKHTASATDKGKVHKAKEENYWVFVCNPKKWAIDRFLERRIEHDSWGVRPSDRHRFAAGQLGILRVGTDSRSLKGRKGKPRLAPGIYALCEVESEAFGGTGAGDEFWSPGQARKPGWPTVKLRYLRAYRENPLTIDRLRAEAPGVSPLLLNGFQASSFPISVKDFHTVVALLGEKADELPSPPAQFQITAAKLAATEKKYLNASPEVKEKLSKTIERGSIGALVKRATGFKCQLCKALGAHPIGFLKRNGEPYVEAHHVMPVSTKEVGSLAASNVMTLCANHHRQMHYGDIEVTTSHSTFDVLIEKRLIKIRRLGIATSKTA